jgi:hypothetical protein
MDFCSRKEAVLFATDVAGRGLDFPEVDWVIQLDCPEVFFFTLFQLFCLWRCGLAFAKRKPL